MSVNIVTLHTSSGIPAVENITRPIKFNDVGVQGRGEGERRSVIRVIYFSFQDLKKFQISNLNFCTINKYKTI